MNYLRHYVQLMRKAEQRAWTKKSAPCYVERHHIFPKKVFGDNPRLVYLTAREHVLAHLLLFKAYLKRYGRHHWKTWKVAGAATAMGIIWERHWGRTPVSCETLGLARKVDAENKSIRYTGTTLPPRPGYKWYNNGVEQTRSKTHPGLGWVEGRLDYDVKPYSERNITEETLNSWAENGRLTGTALVETGQWEKVRCKDGRGGAAGKGNLWWNNGVVCTRAEVCPGEGWVRGRLGAPLLKGKNHHRSKPVYLSHPNWNEEKFYESISLAALDNNVGANMLAAVARGKRNHHKGFTARYA